MANCIYAMCYPVVLMVIMSVTPLYYNIIVPMFSKPFTVEKYRISDYGGELIRPQKNLMERRLYAADNRLRAIVRYTSKVFFDSTAFHYDNDTLRELTTYTNFRDLKIKKKQDLRLIYQNGKLAFAIDGRSNEKITDLVNDENVSIDLGLNNPDKWGDSLGLLNNELHDINRQDAKLVAVRKLENGLVRREYTSVLMPGIFADYSVPHQSVLKKYYVYLTGNRIVRDEFIYENLMLQRVYEYQRSLIKTIHVIMLNKRKKIIRKDDISFEYK